jgi:hypothetical protein
LAAVASYYALAPDVRVSPSDPVVDPTDPFTAHFALENAGVLAIHSVNAGCSFPHLNYGKWVFSGNPEFYVAYPIVRLDSLAA